MAIQWMDNFNIWGSGAVGIGHMLEGAPYGTLNGSGPVADPDGVSVNKVLVSGGTNNGGTQADNTFALPQPTTKVGVATRFFLLYLPTANGHRPSIISYRSLANDKLIDLVVEPNGSLSAYNCTSNDLGTLIATTTVPVITPGTWYHIEMLVDSVAGSVQVWVEGVRKINATPSLASVTYYILGWAPRQNFGTNPGDYCYMKDLVIYDGTGSHNTGPVGTVSVYNLDVNGDVSSGWTCSTGTSPYQLLDEVPPNDADYISADASLPAATIMSLTNLPGDIIGIRGIMPIVRANKSDGGDANLQLGVVSGSSTALGNNRPIQVAKAYYYDVIELDPATSDLWNPTSVNAANLKINRTV